MKWKTHVAITRASCRALGIPEYYEAILVDGAVEPDRSPVMISRGGLGRKRVAHHGSSARAIIVLIWKARQAFLDGDDEHACRHLGRALHYVQDRCVAKGRNWADHNTVEGQIAQMVVPIRYIDEGIERSHCSPEFVRECLDSIKPSTDPIEALCQASSITSALICSVLGDGDQGYGQVLVKRPDPLRFLSLASSSAGAVAIIIVAFSTGTIAGLTLLALPAAIVILTESKQRKTRELAEWYGAV